MGAHGGWRVGQWERGTICRGTAAFGDHTIVGRVYLSSCVLSGPKLVAIVSLAAQGMGLLPQGSVDVPALPT